MGIDIPKSIFKNKLLATMKVNIEAFNQKSFDDYNYVLNMCKTQIVDQLVDMSLKKILIEEYCQGTYTRNFIGTVYVFSYEELINLIKEIKAMGDKNG